MYDTECANPTLSWARLSLSANAVVTIEGPPTWDGPSPFLFLN